MAVTAARAVPAAGQLVCVGGTGTVVGVPLPAVGVLPWEVVVVPPPVVGVGLVPPDENGEQAESRNMRQQLEKMSKR